MKQSRRKDAAKPVRPDHPYREIADYRHWFRAPGYADPAALDPVTGPKFTILPSQPVATAGSCFAQNVAKHLDRNGFNILLTEAAPSFLAPELHGAFQYGVYSTRCGNVYTTRQLRQLFERALGRASYGVGAWPLEGGVVDPFRPTVATFESEEEMLADRAQHEGKVREMMETLSVFVFTMGMTEAWTDATGAVFPIAPGVSGGVYDRSVHRLLAFRAAEVAEDMRAAIALLHEVNPTAKVVLTVSPQAIMATGIDRHVLVSSTNTKSILRVAAQEVADEDPRVDYFPSYEIVTAPQIRGRYFKEDARSVTDAGVEHVMRVFLKHYGDAAASPDPKAGKAAAARSSAKHRAAMQSLNDALCDEDRLAKIDD